MEKLDSYSEPQHVAETPALLTVPEACEALRISRWKLYRLINQRQLKTIRIGRRRLVPRVELSQLITRLSAEDDRP